MGIAGLWPLLEPTSIPTTLEVLEGKKLAVDVSLWIYQAQMGYSNEVRCPHLALLVNRMCKLLFYRIRPVFVFDGPDVPVFKHRVLDSRRLKKIADDVTLNPTKKKHMKKIASGTQSSSQYEASINKLISPKKGSRNDDMFRVPEVTFNMNSVDKRENEESTSEEEVYDDEVVVVRDDFLKEEASVSDVRRQVEILVDERERLRKSRLNPSKIPTDSQDFSTFQLRRLLSRGRLNAKIEQLAKGSSGSSGMNFSVRGPHGEQHILKYGEDDDVVEIKEQTTEFSRPLPEGFDLSLDYLRPQIATYQKNESLKDNMNVSSESDFGEKVDRYLSKSEMIGEVVRRRGGPLERAAAQSDAWSCSDDDDFIDVPEEKVEGEEEEGAKTNVNKKEQEKKESVQRPTTPEWDPARFDKELESSSGTHDDWKTLADVADDKTLIRDPGVYKDLQDFLTACGFPWIEAPGEAEAQCVELERLGLVEGVVSDDSDVWAFGAQNHYNFLNTKKKLGLEQEDYVALAIISGGDYSSGLRQIGMITALEILAEFSDKRSHQDVTSAEKRVTSSIYFFSWRRFYTAELRKALAVIKVNNELKDVQKLVNRDVIKAYFEPKVDDSSETLRWKAVDVSRVRQMLSQQLGVQGNKFEEQILVPLNRWNDFIARRSSYQRHITSYAHKIEQSSKEQKTQLTKRSWNALKRLATRTENPLGEESSLICQASFVDEGSSLPEPSTSKSTKPATTRKRGAAAKRGKSKTAPGRKTNKKSEAVLRLSESSDSDFD
ncbi:unnamed protein product [Caenorhabditis auriculariae]|uniref:Uncharacterized protein n=1 Tax=Caenorhabditis auriculariae TaxID=2777116 RepID=A0A8S1HDY1_9PELO|nr:unnamed protein product [Caenorhabditis auriculariae]